MPKSISGLFGGGSSGNFGINPPNALQAKTPGLNLQTNQPRPGVFVTNLTKRGSDAQTAQAERFPRILGDTDALRETLTPGFSDLREASTRAIGNARNKAIGNLRQTLTQRRVSGSSFGEQALASVERDFAEAEAESQAQSFLAELDANMKVLAFETAQVNDALNRELTELGIATGQTAQLAQLNTQSSQALAQLKAQEASSRGSGIGSLLGTAAGFALGGPLGGAIGGSLGGGASAVGGSQGGFVPSGDRGFFSGLGTSITGLFR